MSNKPSAETELRTSRRLLSQQRASIAFSAHELTNLRYQLKKAMDDAAEWKRRFDELLARVPLRSLCGGTRSTDRPETMNPIADK